MLWQLARAAIEGKWDEVDDGLFEGCLAIKSVGVGKLTTGLFWVTPTRFLPVPSTTVNYLKANGITVDVSSKKSYDSLLAEVRVR